MGVMAYFRFIENVGIKGEMYYHTHATTSRSRLLTVPLRYQARKTILSNI